MVSKAVWRTLYTTPMPPWPSWPRTSYLREITTAIGALAPHLRSRVLSCPTLVVLQYQGDGYGSRFSFFIVFSAIPQHIPARPPSPTQLVPRVFGRHGR